MTTRLPLRDSILIVFKLQLIAWHESDVVAFVGEHEVGKTLLACGLIPSDLDVTLRLTLLELLVVVGFEFDQWLENLSVLLRVTIAQEDWLLLDLLLDHFEVLHLCLGLLFPEFFKSVDLLRLDLS